MYGGREHGEVVSALPGQQLGVQEAAEQLALHLDPAAVAGHEHVAEQAAEGLDRHAARWTLKTFIRMEHNSFSFHCKMDNF